MLKILPLKPPLPRVFAGNGPLVVLNGLLMLGVLNEKPVDGVEKLKV